MRVYWQGRFTALSKTHGISANSPVFQYELGTDMFQIHLPFLLTTMPPVEGGGIAMAFFAHGAIWLFIIS